MEENNNQVKGKKNNVLMILLIVIIIGLGAFIVYDRVISNNSDNVNNNANNNDSEEETKDENKEISLTTAEESNIKTAFLKIEQLVNYVETANVNFMNNESARFTYIVEMLRNKDSSLDLGIVVKEAIEGGSGTGEFINEATIDEQAELLLGSKINKEKLEQTLCSDATGNLTYSKTNSTHVLVYCGGGYSVAATEIVVDSLELNEVSNVYTLKYNWASPVGNTTENVVIQFKVLDEKSLSNLKEWDIHIISYTN